MVNNMMMCEVPKLFPGSYFLEISMNGADKVFVHSSFKIYSSPVLKSVFPTSINRNDGKLLTISGTGFCLTKELMCKFSNDEVIVKASYKDSNNIECIAPSNLITRNGFGIQLSICLNDQDFLRITLSLSLHETPIITYIDPPNGNYFCGTHVIIHGIHGLVPIQICNGPGNISERHVYFEYYREPQINFAHPLSDDIRGGTIVTVFQSLLINKNVQLRFNINLYQPHK